MPATTTYTPNNLNEYADIALNGGTPAVPAYDANGSLSGLDGVTYVWDDENRLIEVYNSTKRSVYTYDGLGKRIRREEYTGSPGSWTLAHDVQYVYDGNLVVKDLDGNGDLLRHYTRGLDVIQTLEGAGGVGSLLAVTERSATTSDYGFYFYDGNGNVTGLLATNDVVAATYSYDPFGGLLQAVESTDYPSNNYRFSTKEYETDWDLYYYLYRFYSPDLGRWLNRDPAGERGGLNLNAFVYNDPVNYIDLLGEKPTKDGGAAEIRNSASALMKECECCVEKDQVSQCKTDASKIAEALAKAWENNFGKGPGSDIDTDRVGGYFCWDWANKFKNVIEEQNSGVWTGSFRMFAAKPTPKGVPVHFAVRIKIASPKPQGPEHKCLGFNYDDGFFEDGCFHGPDWPKRDDYTEVPPEMSPNPNDHGVPVILD